MRRHTFIPVGALVLVASLCAVLVAQAPQRVPVAPSLAKPSRSVVHKAGKLDAVAATPARIDPASRPPVRVSNVPFKPMSDAEKMQLFVQAAGIIGPKFPAVTGVITKATLTPRRPFVPNQAMIVWAALADWAPGQPDWPNEGEIIFHDYVDTPTLDMVFLPFRAGQPVLVTVDIEAKDAIKLRFFGDGFDQQVELGKGRQTLSVVVMTASTAPHTVILRGIAPNKDWIFYGAEFTVLK